MQPMTFWGRMLLVVGATALSQAMSVAAQVTTNAVEVHFFVTGCWGTPISAATIRVSSLERHADTYRLSYPTDDTIGLKPGRYTALVEATGFFSSSSVVEVPDTGLDFQGCLTVAPVSGTTRPWVTFKASLSTEIRSKGGQFWARLVALYSDANYVSSVDNQGRVSFSKLQPGRYLLLLFDRSGLRYQKEVDVREVDGSVNIP